MGAFFIAASSIAERSEKLDAAHRDLGFALARKIAVGRHTLYHYRKLDGQGGHFVELPEGGFACLVGQLTYRGVIGEEALRRYCLGLALKAVDADRVIGQFALLRWTDAALHISTDPMNFYQVYVDEEAGLASSSFWAMLELLRSVSIDPTGVYQYAWNGATFGGRTFVREIRRLPPDTELVVGERMALRRRPAPPPAPPARIASFERLVDIHSVRLRTLFSDLASCFNGQLRVSFSGGYDSRLMLAGLRAAGLRPSLFVYGRDGDSDVEIAKQVAAGEGLALEVIDKGKLADASACPCRRQEKDAIRFDGWKVDGIFDDGSDAVDRQSRHEDGGVPLNGSLGEIYRNFFYIRDRSMPLRSVVDSFFSTYAPQACTGRFSSESYAQSFVSTFSEALGTRAPKVRRDQVERLYPLVRGRYWTGRDVNLNLRFGQMIFPFMQPHLITGTAEMPIAFKNHGLLEAKLIERLAPSLAAYPSAYGYHFCDPPPLRHRAHSWLTLFRPPVLRRLAYRLRFARRQPFPSYLTRPHLARFMDVDMPYMRRFFHPQRLHDPDVYNRVATMEYLFQRYNAQD